SLEEHHRTDVVCGAPEVPRSANPIRFPSSMIRTRALAVCVATLTSAGMVAWSGAVGDVPVVRAGGQTEMLFADPDGDLVPNCLELLMLTDPGRADSDGDSVD